jgi:adenylate cyclase
MASFRSAQAALDCAIDLQRRFAKPLSDLNERLRVRVGLNAGEPIAEDGDLFGAAVIRAARIAALARGSEIFVANVVRELVDGKGYLFADEGQHALRGLDEPVRLWSLRWSERND